MSEATIDEIDIDITEDEAPSEYTSETPTRQVVNRDIVTAPGAATGRRKQAIALEYGMNTVPVVTAKADAHLAEQLIEEARRQGVYVTEDPQLLALLSRLNVDDEIPPELYTAVAVILSWVYWLKGMRPGDEKRGGRPAVDEAA